MTWPNRKPPSDVRGAVNFYAALGFRCVPLFGVDGRGYCSCGDMDCKPRDAGKHEPPQTDGAWKDGRVFLAGEFEPTNNVALAMGPWRPGSWLVCMDFDGIATSPWPQWETLTQRSPRGFHAFYTVPEYEPLGNWVDCLQTKVSQGWQLDLRYARGRIVADPSRGATGSYSWLNWREPAPMPQDVLDMIYESRIKRGLPVLPMWERGGKNA